MLISIRLTTPDRLITPEELPELLEKVNEAVPGGGSEPVILSGRLPVWAFCALAHHFHPRPWVATYEPRLLKGVVVASHAVGVAVGDIVDAKVEEPDVVVEFP